MLFTNDVTTYLLIPSQLTEKLLEATEFGKVEDSNINIQDPQSCSMLKIAY